MHQDIYSAVIIGDILAVEDYLTRNGDPNLINEKGDPILVDALIKRHVEVVYMLLEAGTDPNIRNRGGADPLQIAARLWILSIVNRKPGADDYKEIMELLLDYGADIDYVNPIFGTSLHEFAKSWWYMEMLEFLLERGANPNLYRLDSSSCCCLRS